MNVQAKFWGQNLPIYRVFPGCLTAARSYFQSGVLVLLSRNRSKKQTAGKQPEELMEQLKPQAFRSSRVVNPPLERIRDEPWAFVGLALTAGFTAAVLWKVLPLRKILRVYGWTRLVR